ncbi:NADH dehydrogenase subunit 5 (mitochondrion) [Australozyma saopauloensis]|uniref:NADH-ubiquinone oxidoreductase chain 5 n=1 Tax=Australozyma saopauloensis TaxID=291208 RepID=A0AAX4HH64_9ASCO|nr:NADH dehydrogenase subunit 5 [[Candida] saopauloensis]
MFTFFHEESIHLIMGNWFSIGEMSVNYGTLLDSLSMTVIVPVGLVTICVLIYSLDYMKFDPNRNRFYIFLSIFAIFMTILVVSDNFVMMFIGWEFVGIMSYLLMSFWNTRMPAMKAALSAMLLNRFGDAFFVMGMSMMLSVYHTTDFNMMELITPNMDTIMLNIMAMTLLMAATAKSAQLGLHSWLLNAMEGPTPVSSLLHAATMVCSGVYVLVRGSFMLEYTPTILLVILWLGGLTTLMSGLIAMVTNDIKRVIALSTMSQLGMMMLAMGSSSYDLAIYHLYCHAFFKALLFMSAGSIIHSLMSESQDFRKYGGLIDYLPYSYMCMLIASLSLMAIPGTTGYFSKDIIIETLYGQYNISGYIMYFVATASATLTSIYSLRLLYLTFMNNPRINKYTYTFVHESNMMIMPMTMLALYSMFLGYYRDNVMFHLNLGLPHTNTFMETEFTMPMMIKYLPMMLGLTLSLTLVYLYEMSYRYDYKVMYNYLNQKMYFDQLTNNVMMRPTLMLAGVLNKNMDNGLLKTLGSTGVSRLLSSLPMMFMLNLMIMLMM